LQRKAGAAALRIAAGLKQPTVAVHGPRARSWVAASPTPDSTVNQIRDRSGSTSGAGSNVLG